jgi:hypothetical protein
MTAGVNLLTTKCEIVRPALPAPSPPLRIPRIFHFVWFGKITPAVHENVTRWERLHPGWRAELWHDDGVSNIPESLTNQAAFDRAQDFSEKSDVLRYEVLLKHGGVYVGERGLHQRRICVNNTTRCVCPPDPMTVFRSRFRALEKYRVLASWARSFCSL